MAVRDAMKEWKIGINSVTLKGTALKTALKVASQKGYDGFGFWVKDIRNYLEAGGDLETLRKTVDSLGLDACELLAVRRWQKAPSERWDVAEEDARSVFSLAQGMGMDIVTSPAGEKMHDEDEISRRLAIVCDIASSYEITIALEFIAGRNMPDLNSTLDLVRSVENDNVGVLLDFFHFHKSESTLEDLRSASGEEVVLVHVDDVLGKPLKELRDKDRVFPGEGVLQIEDIASVLDDIGYQGYFSIEIFNEDYWQMDPDEVAERAILSTRKSLGMV